jgi:hypothetical protein
MMRFTFMSYNQRLTSLNGILFDSQLFCQI